MASLLLFEYKFPALPHKNLSKLTSTIGSIAYQLWSNSEISSQKRMKRLSMVKKLMLFEKMKLTIEALFCRFFRVR
jgi:hypothetical protein